MNAPFVIFTLLIGISACSSPKGGIKGASCNASSDCEGTLQCLKGVCAENPEESQEPKGPQAQADENKVLIQELRAEVQALKKHPNKPSPTECRAFAEKVVELTVLGQDGAAADSARTMVESMKPEIIQECISTGTRAEVDCALRASTLKDFARCEGSNVAD